MRLVVTAGRVLRRAAGLLTLLTLIALPAVAQEHANKANWALADQFSTANLRSRLKEEAIANADRDLAMAAEWFPLEEEAWQTFKASPHQEKNGKKQSF